VRRVDTEEATSASTRLTPTLLTPPLSSKLLRIPYTAGIILVAPDDGRMHPKHVELSLLLQKIQIQSHLVVPFTLIAIQ
jgi:hypothetical protein